MVYVFIRTWKKYILLFSLGSVMHKKGENIWVFDIMCSFRIMIKYSICFFLSNLISPICKYFAHDNYTIVHVLRVACNVTKPYN